MKEDILRKMIRNQIKSTLTESPMMDKTRGIVTQKLGNVEKMAGVKMLKKALEYYLKNNKLLEPSEESKISLLFHRLGRMGLK